MLNKTLVVIPTPRYGHYKETEHAFVWHYDPDLPHTEYDQYLMNKMDNASFQVCIKTLSNCRSDEH